ncbi:hypothetical protein ACKZDW_00645 (plasmid) [Ralstonia syzygii subsp. celebesensis]|uniref:hypothetical protein n=1 Tax=Ralstonia solanacearum species complex TaxID=3116862 RepID=UPI000B3B937E|nr:aerotaxis receptor Aer [Ralstonia solanacearum]QWF64307.1 hypothetical protein KM864_21990 [Ralstonia solanacearum]
MDIETLAETIAYALFAVLATSLGIWLLIELPLWAVPLVFGVAVFFGLAFVGPAIAAVAFVAAATIKATAWLISHRRARA